MYYFDNAATSFPKNPAVEAYLLRYLREGGTYGRSASQRNFAVSATVETTREKLAATFGVAPDTLAFTAGATDAINSVLHSVLTHSNKRRILVSPLEHNAVMRTLEYYRAQCGFRIEIMPHTPDGTIRFEALQQLDLRDVALVAVCHASNVNGVIQPLTQIKQAIGTVPILVDASQSAGVIPLNLDTTAIDWACFGAHKGFAALPGIGALYAAHRDIEPTRRGGTGSNSASYAMPSDFPDRLEAGTPNLIGIYGWLGALENPLMPAHTSADFENLIAAARSNESLRVYGADDPECQCEVFSITHRHLAPSELGEQMSRMGSIETRIGLHCAPLAHQTLGTLPTGTVRLSPAWNLSAEELHRVADFLKHL